MRKYVALGPCCPQVKGEDVQAKLLMKMQVRCAITFLRTSYVRSCYWIAIPHLGPTFRFLPVTLCRLVYLPTRHEDPHRRGGKTPPIIANHVSNPWLTHQGSAKRPRYPEASRHSHNGKTDSAALCFTAGVLVARHGLFRACECAAPIVNCLSCE
jgi:hypothetical protein